MPLIQRREFDPWLAVWNDFIPLQHDAPLGREISSNITGLSHDRLYPWSGTQLLRFAMRLESLSKDAREAYGGIVCIDEGIALDPPSTTGSDVDHWLFSTDGLSFSVTVRSSPHHPPPIATSNWIVS